MTKMDAIREAAVMRLRPILMTTIATIFGTLPIALALGSGALSRRGMGFAVMEVADRFGVYVVCDSGDVFLFITQ